MKSTEYVFFNVMLLPGVEIYTYNLKYLKEHMFK